MTPRPACERGAATVFATSALVMLLVIGTVLVELTGLVRAHRRAQAAADLAALAAAADSSCATAATIAARNGAELTTCALDPAGTTARVGVQVEAVHWWGPAVVLTGQARAGPASGLTPGSLG